MTRSIRRRAVALALLACAALPIHAQTLPAMDFARHAEINEVALSPDGKHVAITAPTADRLETQLQIVELATGKTQVLRFGKLEHVSDVFWSGAGRVVLARATNRPLRPRPYSRGQLFWTDISGKDQETLFGYFRDQSQSTARHKDNGFAQVVKVLDGEPGKILVSFTCWDCGEDPDTVIYKVDVRTGGRAEIEGIGEPAGLIFDQSGRARIRSTWDDNDEPVLAYRPTDSSDWTPLPKSIAGYDIGFGVFNAAGDTLYASISDAGEAYRFFRVNLVDGSRTLLSELPDTSPAYFQAAGRNGLPFAIGYDEGKPAIQYVDAASDFAKLHAGLMKSFPGELVRLEDSSTDANIVLFSVASDRNPGDYYIYDRAARKATLVAKSRPWIDPSKMATSRPIQFQGGQGLTLHGFYTASGAGTRPLIIIPHGGPHGIYDSWGFDSDAQFFASRGYGVLQVNFRGSGARGQDFERLGYREWGGKMQDDIAAGMQWAIDNKLADPARICTYDASYGGYAALMQPIRYLDLYKCAVGYVGVYDLVVMKNTGDIDDTRRGRRYLDRVLGTDQTALVANSPARNVDKLRVPVFLAQGAIDQQVPMAQFKALRNALAASGSEVETMVAPGEGHGFYKAETRADLYQRVEKFLQANLAP